MKKRNLSRTWMYSIIFAVVVIAIVLFLLLNQTPNQSNLLIIKDQMIIPNEKCSQLDQYSIIYKTGCQHCAKVLPRIQEVEQSLNLSFKHYNLAIPSDFSQIEAMGIMPEGVPAVIINCKAYLGSGYTTEDFKGFILQTGN